MNATTIAATSVLAVLASAAPAHASVPAAALAEAVGSAAQSQARDASTELRQKTMAQLMRRVTVEFNENRLEDVVEFITSITEADIEPLWIDDRTDVGLDPDTTVTLKARDVTALDLIEMVLEDADREADWSDGSTWQFTKYGTFEFGPRERLNKRRRLEIYDINDLLFVVPDFDQAPEFDLNSVFQQGGQSGGGGGQSPFQQNQQNDRDPDAREARAQEIIDLISTIVEPEQWIDSGGEAGTITYYRGNLLIKAPDYMHRNLAGYGWWPGITQTSRADDEGQRYVAINDTEIDLEPYLGTEALEPVEAGIFEVP